MDLKRRRFLQVGLIGGGILAAVRIAYEPPGAVQERAAGGYPYEFLNAHDRALFAILIPVVLAGAIPAGNPETVERVLQALDRSLLAPAPAVQEELRDLIRLLEFPITRRLLAGIWSPWHEASREKVGNFLERWRTSRFALFNGAYVAIATLIKCAWYGLPESFAGISYAGPPEIAIKQLLGGKAW